MALIVNDSRAMAKEITIELALKLPGCSVMYAPSIELAKWILKRRKLQLVVSSPMLPDGGFAKLRETLEQLENPPDLLVVGEIRPETIAGMKGSRYRCTEFRRYGAPHEAKAGALEKAIADLGADLRNDLNNPLQEIVAMVFVAQATGASSTDQALGAIDRAAKNMARVVSGLENKIREAVSRSVEAS